MNAIMRDSKRSRCLVLLPHVQYNSARDPLVLTTQIGHVGTLMLL